MQADSEHLEEIAALAQRDARPDSARDPIVVESWLRCLEKHGLDPSTRAEAYIVPDRQLRVHRERSEELISIARSGIDNLYKLVAGQNYVLLLSDAAGVTVEYLGDAVNKEALRKSGLFIGAEWSESRAGTCAVGACIEAGEPLIIHQSDHFDVTHGALSCTAAPIYDTSGQLSAVLDISLLCPPRPRESQYLALNLVQQTARRIEMANIMAESRRDWVLRLAGSPDFLDVDPEAALSLDAGGHVISMTNGAARLMARTLGVDWRRPGDLLGRHVSEVFDLDLTMFEGLTRQAAARDRLIETRDGYRLFAHAIEPRRAPAPRFSAPRRMPDELRRLAGDDPAMTALLQQAALLAQRQNPMLIESETGSGKSTLARAIHAIGGRGPCLTVPCESLTEAEAAIMFGREEKRRFEPGLLDSASGGTLVVDNIDELPLRLQAGLVKYLTEGSYRPVGAIRERRSQARVIATITGNPETAVAEGRLRRDLHARLLGARLVLPPLRQRRDLLTLADQIFAASLGQRVIFDSDVVTLLAAHRWAGNLHEMTQLAQSVAAACGQNASGECAVLSLRDFPDHLSRTAAPSESVQAVILARHLQETGWNISETARRMGVNRSTIHRNIKRFSLQQGH
ncbi:sigma-54-dependent Fis family transcriptional regulator [Phaeovulum sp. W22_SRMD_FR3]|uniref:sigma-54-dependent Fis family transcriptional regulator n=1 Tax=Phaeovulum sp. W22_SRMD_FR3 TaxID=3240274 RepID=UPI003F9A3212